MEWFLSLPMEFHVLLTLAIGCLVGYIWGYCNSFFEVRCSVREETEKYTRERCEKDLVKVGLARYEFDATNGKAKLVYVTNHSWS